MTGCLRSGRWRWRRGGVAALLAVIGAWISRAAGTSTAPVISELRAHLVELGLLVGSQDSPDGIATLLAVSHGLANLGDLLLLGIRQPQLIKEPLHMAVALTGHERLTIARVGGRGCHRGLRRGRSLVGGFRSKRMKWRRPWGGGRSHVGFSDLGRGSRTFHDVNGCAKRSKADEPDNNERQYLHIRKDTAPAQKLQIK
jgi:hypothetical protein